MQEETLSEAYNIFTSIVKSMTFQNVQNRIDENEEVLLNWFRFGLSMLAGDQFKSTQKQE